MAYNEESFWAGLVVGQQLKGTMAIDREGAAPGKLSDITVRSQPTTFIEVPASGFYGIGSVTVEGDENLVPENIKNGITILGIDGTYVPASTKLMVGNSTVTENGVYTFYPSRGYDGLSQQKVTVNVPKVEEVIDAVFQSKNVTPKSSEQTVTPDDGYNALSSVVVAGDNNLIDSNIRKGATIFGVHGSYEKTESIDAVLQSKNITPSRSGQTIEPDSGYDGLSKVYIVGDSELIPANIREGITIFGVEGSYSSGQVYQNKSVVPARNNITVTADSDYNALAQVTVVGDSNLLPDKIAKGETIFGVTGTYVSPMNHITVVPSLDEQYIIPANGISGFSSITVVPVEATGEYADGFAAGMSSRDEEIAELLVQINTLKIECNEKYELGYNAGYEAGTTDVAASYKDLDEVKY